MLSVKGTCHESGVQTKRQPKVDCGTTRAAFQKEDRDGDAGFLVDWIDVRASAGAEAFSGLGITLIGTGELDRTVESNAARVFTFVLIAEVIFAVRDASKLSLALQ